MRRPSLLLAATIALSSLAVAVGAAEGASARTIGAYVDPWHVDDWARDTGVRPDYVARFEAFSRGGAIDGFLRESERRGLRSVLITWEPWRPVPPELGVVEQYRPQPGYTNAEIAARGQDPYLDAVARQLATFHGRVYLRYAHEMNGTWYPWSRDPIAYRRAWRHVVARVHAAGARNVRFVWAPNPSLYLPFDIWLRSVRVYWPGARWVDAVGSTMIGFGGARQRPVGDFLPRLKALRQLYRKPVMLTEANTAHHGRVRWMRALARALRDRPWIPSLAWFGLQSRAQAHLEDVGRLEWDIRRDPAAARALRAIARSLRRP